jgi:NADH:ubiquinone oxidoreductase subunit 3 (subunit A)
MINVLILAPPAVFIIVLLVVLFASRLLSELAFQQKERPKGQAMPYSCGEDIPDQMIEHDYIQFFPFAFYFTILHVVALMIATVPKVATETIYIAVVYIIGAIIGLLVLYRR